MLQPTATVYGTLDYQALIAGHRSLHGAGGAALIEEVPVAFVCNRVTLAVMMATPDCIVDFAVGYSWTESLSTRPLTEQQVSVRI